MELVEAKQNGVVILGVQGRLDASNADTVEQRLLALIAAGERRLVIDCAQLDYISSAGLRVLLVAAKRLTATGGNIVVAALKEPIKEIFDIAGFAALFRVYRSQDEAAAALS
jgi:anti-sigma B factor antagonist